METSVVTYYGSRGFQRCGYCQGLSCKINHGMWAHYLTCQDYQDLLDRGWRRSGKYCYKPIMDQTCCPQYTIRLDVTNAKLRKSQKKVIKTFNNYLSTGLPPKSSANKKENEEGDAVNDVEEGCLQRVEPNSPPKMDISFSGLVKGADPNKPKCRKAKEIRMEKKLAKSKTESDQQKPQNQKKGKKQEKSYEEWIEGSNDEAKVKFEVKLVRSCPEDDAFTETFDEEFKLYRKYQIVIHKDKEDEMNEKQFRRFLCDGPLIPVDQDDVPENEIPICGLGAFHQQYYLDGKLVAVGVLDILPNSVSSKYFFYDPDYHFLSLGTYSALREIYFIRSLNSECPAIKYYYMGYYIHSCAKMKYKGKFIPSYLLCPETYQWKAIEDCLSKLDASKYSRLEEDPRKEANKYNTDDTLVLYTRQAMPFQIFLSFITRRTEREEHEETVEEYTNLTGKASRSLLLFRS